MIDNSPSTPQKLAPLYGMNGAVPGPTPAHFAGMKQEAGPDWNTVLGEEPDTGAADADDK